MGSRWVVHEGDCRELARAGKEHAFDAIVCDPPYHLTSIVKRFGKKGSAPAKYGSDGRFARLGKGFMNQTWDGGDVAFDPETWAILLRVLKPGGHLIVFGGTRTYHRMACAVEDAGFEIRDALVWLQGQGFPKSLDVAHAIDKAARGVPQGSTDPTSPNHGKYKGGCSEENPSGRGFGAGPGQFMRENGVKVERELVAEAQMWEGFGTALKPAWESIVLARAPLSEKTVATNVLRWGTGAINIDGCRIETADNLNGGAYSTEKKSDGQWGTMHNFTGWEYQQPNGRWPANVVLDKESACQLDVQSGLSTSPKKVTRGANRTQAFGMGRQDDVPCYGDFGGASRFFYVAKASKSERGEGNIHPTCKPVALMRWLVRLVTPPNGVILDPFCGSGSTGVAALQEGFRFVGIDAEPSYVEIARKRLAATEGTIAEKVPAG